MLESAFEAQAKMSNQQAQEVMERVIYLHAIFRVKEHLGWFTAEGCISSEAGLEVQELFDRAVKEFVPHMNTCVEALGIFTHKHLIGPIGRDYVAFNAQNDNENYAAAGEVFDFRKTGEPRARL
jgi:hypothetical protein